MGEVESSALYGCWSAVSADALADNVAIASMAILREAELDVLLLLSQAPVPPVLDSEAVRWLVPLCGRVGEASDRWGVWGEWAPGWAVLCISGATFCMPACRGSIA